jgi:hypothetical protein
VPQEAPIRLDPILAVDHKPVDAQNAALSGWSFAQSQSGFDRIKGRGLRVINYREDAAPFS